MSGDQLLDEDGLPKPYEMVEVLEKAVENGVVRRDLFRELDALDGFGLNYREAVESITLELAFFIGEEEAERLKSFLRDYDFESAYRVLDDQWTGSVNRLYGEEPV